MAQISKKTALVWVLIVAAALGIWRFIWHPLQFSQKECNIENLSQAISPSEKKIGICTSYKNPGGEDEVGFSVTVDEAGVITATTVEVLAKNPISVKRQEAFAEGLPQAIKGKKLSELTAIDKVGGSSLTTASFNASLAQLKAGI